MGNASNAPIEPQSQTALLDCTLDSPGILLAGAPGAGGYDAIFCIGLSIEALDKVDLDVWKNWPGVKALNCKESYDFGLD